MSSQDWNQESSLNESRFLIEELNLEEEPTQQEILERAEQLQIDDLVLAKQSLTRELDPEWKPYCNRYSKIYYINLVERLAYLDHPIDMYYKQEYAKDNGMPVPRFQNFKIQQISQSLELIEEEIKKFQRSHKTSLRIVYEQPSQEQALSSYLKSPSNQHDDFQSESQRQLQALNINQLESLNLYQKQLEEKYYQQYLQKKKELRAKQIVKAEEHEKSVKFILQRKIEEICETYQDELVRKNKISLKKQEEKIEDEYQQRRMEYCESIEKFNKTFEKFREKHRNIETLYQNKNASQRATAIGSIKLKTDYEKLKAISAMQDKMKQEFGQKMISLYNISPNFQESMINSVEKSIEPLIKIYERKIMERPRKPLFESKNAEIRKIETDIEFQQLKKQIKELTLWESEDNQIWSGGNRGRFNSTNLNLKLRMRAI